MLILYSMLHTLVDRVEFSTIALVKVMLMNEVRQHFVGVSDATFLACT